MICFGVIEQTKLNPLTCANFNFTIFSALISPKRTRKGPKWNFSSIRLTILFYRPEKLHSYPPSLTYTCFWSTKFFFFCFCERTYDSLYFAFFGIFLVLRLEPTYDSTQWTFAQCPCWFFHFRRRVRHRQKRARHDIYLQRHERFILILLHDIFVSSCRTFLCDPSYDSTRILSVF